MVECLCMYVPRAVAVKASEDGVEESVIGSSPRFSEGSRIIARSAIESPTGDRGERQVNIHTRLALNPTLASASELHLVQSSCGPVQHISRVPSLLARES
jgi:hypothetical protein